MENTQNIVLGVEINYQYKMDILYRNIKDVDIYEIIN